MDRKILLFIIFILTFIITCAIVFLKIDKRYNELIVNEEDWNEIISTRVKAKKGFLENIKFNDYSLLIDNENNKLYYSLLESNSKRYNPRINFKTTKKASVVILQDRITEDLVNSDYEFKLMLYTDREYQIYTLTCTNLPILNISYSLKDGEKLKDILVKVYLFDNKIDSRRRIINSDGKLKVTGHNQYRDYVLSLISISLGNNRRANNIKLLNLDIRDEYLLRYQYKYNTSLDNQVRLFINNHYEGIYILEHNDKKRYYR